MDLYSLMDEQKRKKLKEIDVTIIKDKDYSTEETKEIFNTVTEYIFSQSKNNINIEMSRYSDILEIIGTNK